MTHAVPIQEHVYNPSTDVCVYCHVPKRNVEVSQADHKPITCIYRWVDAPPAGHRPIHRAADDFDMIGARLAQLRAERDEENARIDAAVVIAFERSMDWI